ncbi:hypothetical protein GS597_13160 [Synechococcales cyanobacterium C]|uniref:Uncharacterized protein n=2 Tax=Petrachloros TaxID=2918834 RepID=A0A8K1ZYD9_9CYAN|nr:hypothetical protein [Petrachloros mirabilis ULC683]
MGKVPFSPFDDDVSHELSWAPAQDQPMDLGQALTHQLSPFPVEIQAHIQAGSLHINLLASSALERQETVEHIQQVLSDLTLPDIHTVQLRCQISQDASTQWQQVWFWPGKAPLPEAQSRLALRDQASQGHLVAMATLVQQTLVHKQVQVQAAQADDRLWLFLSADHPLEPQPCAILVCRELIQWSWQSLELKQVILASPSPQLAWGWLRELSVTPVSGLTSIAQMAVGKHQGGSCRRPIQGVTPDQELPIQTLDRETWQVIAASLFLAVLIMLSSQVSFFVSVLITAIHELGHTAFAWLFGYPAIPAFDFLHGGGITFYTQQRWPVLVFILYFGLGYLLYRYRHNALMSRYVLGTLVLYSLCLLTQGQDILIAAMGHGFELLFAGIFLYRSLSGFACRHAIERPLYGMLGLFTVLYNLKFTQSLLFNPMFRAQYQEGKGGLLDHDLIRLARDYLHLPFNGVVGCFWLSSLLTPVGVFLLYRYRYWVLSHLQHCLRLAHR